MMQGNLLQEKAFEFIMGGNALFTVKSNKTGQRYTFKVLHDRHIETQYKVYIMNGSDNTKDYKQIGVISIQSGSPIFKAISTVHNNEPIVAFDHIFLNLCIGLHMPQLEIWHEGRCCRCGRILTVPESISNGIGPECIKSVVHG